MLCRWDSTFSSEENTLDTQIFIYPFTLKFRYVNFKLKRFETFTVHEFIVNRLPTVLFNQMKVKAGKMHQFWKTEID